MSAIDPAIQSAIDTSIANAALNASPLNDGDTAWMLVSTALVLMMTPALALFYGGMVSNKHIINTLFLSFITMGIVSIQWLLFGYSFAFSYGSKVWGDFQWAVLRFGQDVNPDYSPSYPQLVHAAYQCAFAIITSALISGALVGRMKLSSYMIFTFLWTTVCYDPLAHWVWSRDGWLRDLGALDFAGGTVIHVASGCSAIVAALILGPRHDYDKRSAHVPSNLPFTFIGAAFLWIGWAGFNAGSAGAANGLAGLALVNTNTAAAAAMLTWVLIDAVRSKASLTGACCGVVTGLVAITPAAGYVAPGYSILFGIVASLIVYPSLSLKSYLTADDTLDVFAVHAVGGMVGALMTGLFSDVAQNEFGFNGAFYGRGIQFGYQLAAVCTAIGWSIGCTAALMLLLKYTMGIRLPLEYEQSGIDAHQHGEGWAIANQAHVDELVAQIKNDALRSPNTNPMQMETPQLKGVSAGNTPSQMNSIPNAQMLNGGGVQMTHRNKDNMTMSSAVPPAATRKNSIEQIEAIV